MTFDRCFPAKIRNRPETKVSPLVRKSVHNVTVETTIETTVLRSKNKRKKKGVPSEFDSQESIPVGDSENDGSNDDDDVDDMRNGFHGLKSDHDRQDPACEEGAYGNMIC